MTIPTADWSRLEVFMAVAETGTITAAAERLKCTQGTVSRDIDELERSLGHPLFLRSTKGMVLTEAGQLALRSARNMADSAQAITTTLTRLSTSTRPSVVIAAHEALATYWLAPRLPAFHQANPKIEIDLRVVPDTPDLLKDDVDIAIQYDQPSGPNVIARQIGWLHYIFFASPGYLSVHGAPEDRYALGRHRLLHLTAYQKQQELWAAKIPAWQEIMPWLVRTNSGTVLVETCAADGGIASLPTYFSTYAARLRPLAHLDVLASVRFWLAYAERVKDLSYCEPVLAWLRECFDPSIHPWFRETYVPPDGKLIVQR